MDEELRKKILSLLDEHRVMTIATLRPDGWPQATTVGYVSEGLTLYFLCGRDSQKAANLARDDRVSLTIDHDTPDLMAITGLSMAAHAQEVLDSDVPGAGLPASADADSGASPNLPCDADGHLGARLLQGLRAHGSRDLLSALSSTKVCLRTVQG